MALFLTGTVGFFVVISFTDRSTVSLFGAGLEQPV